MQKEIKLILEHLMSDREFDKLRELIDTDEKSYDELIVYDLVINYLQQYDYMKESSKEYAIDEMNDRGLDFHTTIITNCVECCNEEYYVELSFNWQVEVLTSPGDRYTPPTDENLCKLLSVKAEVLEC